MNILKFSDFLNEGKINKILYHGSPYKFKEFKNTITFFSDDVRFAEQYSETKSFDYGLDASPNIYKVEVITDLFNINDNSDYKKLKEILPDKVEYAYNNFGFTEKVDKEDILFWMKGYYMTLVNEDAKKAKVNDKIDIKISMSQSEEYLIVKKDDNFAYGISMRDLQRNTEYKPSYKFTSHAKYYDLYKPVIDYVENYANKEENKKYLSDSMYYQYYLQFFNNDKNNYTIVDKIPQKYIDEFNKIYKKAEDNIIKKMIDDEYYKKFIIKSTKEKLKNTWRYYENKDVTDAIIKLGYGGYIALEDNVNTYAIFKPKDDVNIIEYKFEDGTFKTWEDYNKYILYKNELYKEISKYIKSIFINDYKIVDYYKNNVPIDKAVDELKIEYKDYAI